MIAPPPRSTSITSASRRASQKSFSSGTTNASKRQSFLIPTTRNPICAICGSSTTLSVGGLSKLPKNTILIRLVDKYSSFHGIRQKMCDYCDSSDSMAINHCQDCLINLCGPCSDSHKKQKITSGHKQVKLEEKKSYDKDERKKASKRCQFHPNSDLKLFCTNCNQVACSECLTVFHNGHKCESIHKTIKLYSKLLHDTINRVRILGIEHVTHKYKFK